MIKEVRFDPPKDITLKVYSGNIALGATDYQVVTHKEIDTMHIIDGPEAEDFEAGVMDEGMIADRDGCYVAFSGKLVTVMYKRGEIECDEIR